MDDDGKKKKIEHPQFLVFFGTPLCGSPQEEFGLKLKDLRCPTPSSSLMKSYRKVLGYTRVYILVFFIYFFLLLFFISSGLYSQSI